MHKVKQQKLINLLCMQQTKVDKNQIYTCIV